MKAKHLMLTMALAVITPLVACNGNATATENKAEASAEASGSDNSLPLDLSFLKNLGVDVTNIRDIEDGSENLDWSDLTTEQKSRLLPMMARMGEEELNRECSIKGAKALPNGFTMLMIGAETGDDSSTELLAIYDREGNLTDYMQLGDCDAFVIGDSDEEYTRGMAEAVDTKITFAKPGEFTIDRTEKEGSWVRDEEKGYSDLSDLKWLVETVKRYTVDNEGHMTLVEQKEVRREGNVPSDRDTTFDDLYMLPMSDSGRIDRLNRAITDRQKKQNDDDDDADYDGIMVVQEYLAGDPDALLTWVYENRDTHNMIAVRLKQLITDPWIEKASLDKAIARLKDPAARQYLQRLTARWTPGE